MKRLEERVNKIDSIIKETKIQEPYLEVFQGMASFVKQMQVLFTEIAVRDWNSVKLDYLKQENLKNYLDLLPENYGSSLANPEYMVGKLGDDYGKMFAYLSMQLRKLIPHTYEQDVESWLFDSELFLMLLEEFDVSWRETSKEPVYRAMVDMIYWNRSENMDVIVGKSLDRMLNTSDQWVVSKLATLDLVDERYLYQFGEYVTSNEIRLAKFIAKLPDETIKKMADTYTEGYRIGFVNGNKDLSKKKTVEIRYNLGFERVVNKAIENFRDMGLKTVIRHAAVAGNRAGFYGAIPNKQCDYDHKEDDALYMDKILSGRKMDAMKAEFEKRKEWAADYAGPAVMEIFGEEPFSPAVKKEALRYDEVQRKVHVAELSKSGEIMNEYIKGEERSFTIIAFPVSSIGDQFEEIFEETIRLNTLDYHLYQTIQQTIIDALDQAEEVLILGKDGNRTNLTVKLAKLTNPEKETKFENCVADVNIPVGEVFTSPVLEGTNGVLHVKRVFLREFEYVDLEITLNDGMIASYSCKNFEDEEENQKYIKENIMSHRDTLPIGEFAIGTNTTAYVMAKKYGIADVLPILIAEKMGPHFAVGDTCYSHSEEVQVYNPNGKEIIAKENAVSLLRKTEGMEKAYTNCHTDITIPYEELGGIWTIKADGSREAIIENGVFVLAGTEELNKPFEKMA